MKSIDQSKLAKARMYIMTHCSRLVGERFIHTFERENSDEVITALSTYQNQDGGFGHGLEGDFLLPDSSPMATSVAFQILSELPVTSQEPILKKGIAFLINSYDPEKKGWATVPRQVNDYPHASWWHYNDKEGGTVIDRNWGNPTAELIGYLLQYRELIPGDFVESLYRDAFQYLLDSSDEMEMHELYCFLRLAERMPPDDFQLVREKLIHMVLNAVDTNPDGWRQYSAQPLDFVKNPGSFLYPALQESVEANLDFWIDSLVMEGVWYPTWSWEGYKEAWEEARKEIVGNITLSRLKVLKAFGCFED